jgi:hypothetical protein
MIVLLIGVTSMVINKIEDLKLNEIEINLGNYSYVIICGGIGGTIILNISQNFSMNKRLQYLIVHIFNQRTNIHHCSKAFRKYCRAITCR